MTFSVPLRHQAVILLLATSLLAACAQQVALQGATPQRVDFSGNWELDYALSDTLQDKLHRVYLDVRRDIERRQAAKQVDRWGGQPPIVLGGNAGNNDVRQLVQLGRLAEYISRATTLDIEQTEFNIRIARQEDFALTCDFEEGESQQFVAAEHVEICGWDQHQLVFQVSLPGGLLVNHRLTMAEDGSKLNVATTVRSSTSTYPFTLNRVYQRFDVLPDGYDCEFTLTRGTVCEKEPS